MEELKRHMQIHNYSWLFHHTYLSNLQNKWREKKHLKLVFIEHYSLQNTHFQVNKKHSPKQTICWVINQISINLKGLKSSRVCSQTTMELN